MLGAHYFAFETRPWPYRLVEDVYGFAGQWMPSDRPGIEEFAPFDYWGFVREKKYVRYRTRGDHP